MGIIKGKTIDSLITPFSSDENYRTFLEAIDSALPALQTVTISCTCANGVVSGTGTYTIGAKYSLTCTPNEGYYFHSWNNEAGVVISNSYVLEGTATTDVSYTASVSKVVTYEISADAVCGTVTGTGFYVAGKTITLICTPTSSDYDFKKWDDGILTPSRTITVIANKHFTAYCQPSSASATYYDVEVAVNLPEAASVTGGGKFKRNTSCGNIQYQDNGISYFTFVKWSDGDTSNPHSPFAVTRDYVGVNAITAIFEDSRKFAVVSEGATWPSEHCTLSGAINGTYAMEYKQDYWHNWRYHWQDWSSLKIKVTFESGYILQEFQYYLYDSNGVRYPSSGYFTYYAYSSLERNIFWYGNYEPGFGKIPLPAYLSTLYVRAVAVPEKYMIRAYAVPQEHQGLISMLIDGVSKDPEGTEFDPALGGDGNVSLVAQEITGTEFKGWKVNGVKISDTPAASYNIFDYKKDCTAYALYGATIPQSKVEFNINPESAGSISAYVNGNQITSGSYALDGQEVTIEYNLNVHYEFIQWDGLPQGATVSGNKATFTAVPGTGPTFTDYNITCQTQVDPDSSTITTSVVPSGSAEITGIPAGQLFWEGDRIQLGANFNEQILQVDKWERSYTGAEGSWETFSTEKNPIFVCPPYSAGAYYIRLTLISQTCMFDAVVDNATTTLYVDGAVVPSADRPYKGDFGKQITVAIDYDTVKYSGVRWIMDGQITLPGETRTFTNDTLESSGGFIARGTLIEKQKYEVILSGTHCTLTQTNPLGFYHEGESCTVTCIPEEGYRWVNWKTGDTVVDDEHNPYTFTVTGTTYLTAQTMFSVAYDVSVRVDGTGRVTGAGGYTAGSNVHMVAIEEEGVSTFYGWYQSDGTTLITHNAEYDFVMGSADVKLVAKFSSATVTVGQIIGEGATVLMSLDGSSWVPLLVNIPKYSNVYLRVSVTHGHHWYHWDDDLSAPMDRTIVADRNIPTGTLTFTTGPSTFLLTVTGNNCTFECTVDDVSTEIPTTGGVQIGEGASVVLTCNPAQGYGFNRWSDGIDVAQRTFTMTEAVTLEALCTNTDGYDIVLFSNQTYEGCSWTPTGTTHVPSTVPPTTITLTATATTESLYEFDYWKALFEESAAVYDNPWTFAPDRNRVIEPHFKFKPVIFRAFGNNCTISAYIGSTDITSQVTGSGYSGVPGEIIMVVANPLPGYSWSAWDDHVTDNPRFFTVMSSTTVTANAVPNVDGPYQVSVTVQPRYSGIAPKISVGDYVGSYMQKSYEGSDPALVVTGDDKILKGHNVWIHVIGKTVAGDAGWTSQVKSWSNIADTYQNSQQIKAVDHDIFIVALMEVNYT